MITSAPAPVAGTCVRCGPVPPAAMAAGSKVRICLPCLLAVLAGEDAGPVLAPAGMARIRPGQPRLAARRAG